MSSSGGGIEIARLKGWPAVAVLLLVFAFGAWRALAVRSTLDTDGRAALEQELRMQYARTLLAEMGDTPTEADVQALLATDRVEIRSLSARGPLDDMVARVEATLDGAPPPDGEISYWRLEWSTVTGWRVRGPTTRVGWWLAVM
ncbi:MAG: hypothetical protein RJQ04_17235 [Longimicrobiales bacterium]